MGDISKTLFGTLNDNDLQYINHELDKLYMDNRNIAVALSNHTKILKMLLDTSSADYKGLLTRVNEDSKTANKLKSIVNDNMKNNFVNTKLVIATLMIDELNEDLDTAINAINDGKHGIVHPQILTPEILKETINEFEATYRMKYHFDNTEDNYQHIISISTIQVAIIRQLLTYIVKIPILEQEEGVTKHVVLIPEKIHETFLAIIPDHEYIISYKDSFTPTDITFLEKCKEISCFA